MKAYTFAGIEVGVEWHDDGYHFYPMPIVITDGPRYRDALLGLEARLRAMADEVHRIAASPRVPEEP